MGGNRTVIMKIYNTLLKHFGPQNWWPIQEGTSREPGQLSDNEKFEVCAGAILTQNTSWKNVERALANLLDNELLSAQAMQRMPENELAELIRPAGYYNQKAERLKLFARALANLRIDVPTRENLLNITGIGPETADSILLYAYEQPRFVIDAYTRRVFSRLGLAKEDMKYKELQKLFHDSILPKEENVGVYKEFHALIVQLCKDFCKKIPSCNGCPLGKNCRFQSTKT